MLIEDKDILIKNLQIENINHQYLGWFQDKDVKKYIIGSNIKTLDELKKYYDKVILDCTHSIQRSRAVYGTQGERALAERYLVSADIFGYNGVFAEVHPNPTEATSDADCQIYLSRLESLVEMANAVGSVSEKLHL